MAPVEYEISIPAMNILYNVGTVDFLNTGTAVCSEKVTEVVLDVDFIASNTELYEMYPFEDISDLTVEEVRSLCDSDGKPSEVCDAQEFAFVV